MVPASPGETAQQARARHNENETHVATFLANMERIVAAQDRTYRERTDEQLLLINELRTAIDRVQHLVDARHPLEGLVESPIIKQLHAAVVEDRNRIVGLVSAVQRLENGEMDKEIAVNRDTLPGIPVLPSSATTRPSRALEDPVVSAPKRFKSSAQPYTDVIYGPVDSNGNPSAIAGAAMELIPGLQPNDVYSARYPPGQPGVVSIRFRDYVKASHFISAIEREPLLEGQTAVMAEGTAREGARLGNMSNRQPGLSPLDIIRGVGKSARRR